MSSTRPLLLCAGIAVQDIIFRVERFPTAARKVLAQDVVVTGGGCAANAAIAIARLGAQARYAGPLGDDVASDAILAGLTAEGVDTRDVVRTTGAQASVSGIFVDETGERMIVTRRGAGLAGIRSTETATLLDGIDVVLIDNRLPDFVLRLADAARERGIPVVLDADKASDADDPLFALATHTIFGADALRDTLGCGDLADALKGAARFCRSFVAVTNGADGVFWLDGASVRWQPAFRVDVMDTLAAGDVFHGAFALALAEEQTPAQCLVFACAAAALKCTRFGGIAGAPDRAAVERLTAGAH